MTSTRKQARRAGLLYLLVGVTAPIALMYVPNKLIVTGDATATASNLRASDALLRLGIGCELFHQVVGIFLVLALYRLFKAVNQNHALLMVILSVLGVPIMLVNVLNEIAAQILVSDAAFLSGFDQGFRDALAFLFIRLHSRGIVVASIFWGLWLFPFAMLVIRSEFIPRAFGYLMMVAGAGYLASAFATLVLPQHAAAVGKVAIIMEMGELPIMIWLLIWGARPQRARAAAA